MGKYKLKPPKYFQGQECDFKPHNKKYFTDGKIVGVKTHYGQTHEGYHIYSIYREGNRRLAHVEESKIFKAWWA